MRTIKIALAVILLLCLLDLPYGFYKLTRFVAMVCFAVFAYEYYEKSVKPLAITFAALALLFQPFAKIALGRTMWNVVDVVAALGLILLVYKQSKRK